MELHLKLLLNKVMEYPKLHHRNKVMEYPKLHLNKVMEYLKPLQSAMILLLHLQIQWFNFKLNMLCLL